ncbi:unnamed protein product [Clonostachys byssicola]|uniref:Xylanolytic transcriptional activator regulatory domain-containing protein n=1 Tax=Clonostachys byssicola TaxID=160290 RepID=A0A9N9U3T1_9HYPO|nr:unnamed protein product [Clonostachys byssicola]
MAEPPQMATPVAYSTLKRRHPYTSIACRLEVIRPVLNGGDVRDQSSKPIASAGDYDGNELTEPLVDKPGEAIPLTIDTANILTPTSAALGIDPLGQSLIISDPPNDIHPDNDLKNYGKLPSLVDLGDSAAILTAEARTCRLFQLGYDTLLRMVTIYEEEVGMSYPVVDLGPLRHYIHFIYGPTSLDARDDTLESNMLGAIGSRHREHLTVIVAIVMVLQGGGQCDTGSLWIRDITSAARLRTRGKDLDVHDITLFVLIAFFHFHSDCEVLAWRMAGEAARMLLELGFHRSEMIRKRCPTSSALSQAVRLFWSVYNTERRFSFGSGLPFVLRDADIHHDLPEPDGTDFTSMYLKSMIAYTRIASDVWRSVRGNVELPDAAADETRDRLDFRILQWRQSLPTDLQFSGVKETFNPAEHIRGHWRLRLMLYLRANHMRIVIHRNIVHRNMMPPTQSRIVNPSSVNTLIEVAQDTIRVLAQLFRTSDLYEIQQKTYNFFLESAVATLLVLFATQESLSGHPCSQDVGWAMDVVRKLAVHSSISYNLWRKLRMIRGIEKFMTGPESVNMRDPDGESLGSGGTINRQRIMSITQEGEMPTSLNVQETRSVPELVDFSHLKEHHQVDSMSSFPGQLSSDPPTNGACMTGDSPRLETGTSERGLSQVGPQPESHVDEEKKLDYDVWDQEELWEFICSHDQDGTLFF